MYDSAASLNLRQKLTLSRNPNNIIYYKSSLDRETLENVYLSSLSAPDTVRGVTRGRGGDVLERSIGGSSQRRCLAIAILLGRW